MPPVKMRASIEERDAANPRIDRANRQQKRKIANCALLFPVAAAEITAPHIVTDTRYSEETALSDEEIGYLLQCELLFVLNEQMKTRIDITASSAHHQPLQWRQSHRCIHASAVPGRSRAAARYQDAP